MQKPAAWPTASASVADLPSNGTCHRGLVKGLQQSSAVLFDFALEHAFLPSLTFPHRNLLHPALLWWSHSYVLLSRVAT